jgi:hypothetical protein|tara:strand:+ start:37 stop:288 length:252 start_codon:yes stop_codon:yes gene_type:complete
MKLKDRLKLSRYLKLNKTTDSKQDIQRLQQDGDDTNIDIERIRAIADDIIADDEWVNDSHSKSEHNGIIAGLQMLINHLNETK